MGQLKTAPQIVTWVRSLIQQQQHGPAIAPIPILEVHSGGCKCKTCGYVALSKKVLRNHYPTSRYGCKDHRAIEGDVCMQQLSPRVSYRQYIHVYSPHSTDSNDSDNSAAYSTYSDDANNPSNTSTQPATADRATAAVNEMLSQYLGGHSDQDPASADDLRNIQQWIISLKWNTLYDELGTFHIRRRVFRLLAVKPGSTPRGRLLRAFIRRFFTLEQAQISTRSSAYRNAIQTTRQLKNHAPQQLLAWRNITSTGGTSDYALTCTKFIMALIQFSSDDSLASYLRLTPLQRQLATELTRLLRGNVPGVNSESEFEPEPVSEPELGSSSASESDHGLVVMSDSESELGSESESELDVEVVIEVDSESDCEPMLGLEPVVFDMDAPGSASDADSELESEPESEPELEPEVDSELEHEPEPGIDSDFELAST
ncbi:hypothetical protein GQ54DRAFT_314936, partial [Martensiomyces pterosporus]